MAEPTWESSQSPQAPPTILASTPVGTAHRISPFPLPALGSHRGLEVRAEWQVREAHHSPHVPSIQIRSQGAIRCHEGNQASGVGEGQNHLQGLNGGGDAQDPFPQKAWHGELQALLEPLFGMSSASWQLAAHETIERISGLSRT